jgi:hypothetical protein
MKAINLKGRKFGRLVVKSRQGSNRRGLALWLCACKCGNYKITTSKALLWGDTRSCGCLQKEKARIHCKNKFTKQRGSSKLVEYRIWRDMHRRCKNPKRKGYERYGGRGIEVCDRWSLFQAFLVDMGSRPSPRHSIDRINMDGDYEPSNCKWSTSSEQARNTRRNHYLTHDGRSQILIDWSKEKKMSCAAILNRISRGWTVEEALGIPIGQRRIH